MFKYRINNIGDAFLSREFKGLILANIYIDKFNHNLYTIYSHNFGMLWELVKVKKTLDNINCDMV